MSMRSALGILVLGSLLAGCSSIPRFTRAGEPGELLSAPPAGKALVNFHRPSNYAGGEDLPVFDRATLIGNTLGGSRFQYVCDPGEHVFISKKDSVYVVQAQLQEGKVYDIVIDISMGFWQMNVHIHALKKDDPRRGEIAGWEKKERLLVPVRSDDAAGYDKKRQPDLQEIQADFLGGSKSDRVVKLAPDDHR